MTRYSVAMSLPGPSEAEILGLFAESDAALRTEPRRALELAIQAEALATPHPGLLARALLKVSVCHFALGEPGVCPHLLEQCLSLARAHGDHRTAFNALTNLGVVSANTGDLARSVSAYEQALLEARHCPEDPGSLGVLNNLGAVHGRVGDLEAALSCFTDALRLAEQSGQDVHLAYGLVNQAQALQQLGRHGDALTTWQRAEDLLGPEHELYAHVLCGLGSAQAQAGDPVAGLALIDQAVLQAQAHEHPLSILSFRLERAALELTWGDAAEARQELQEVLDEATQRELTHLAIRTCETLAESCAAEGDFEQAWALGQTLRELERLRLNAENAKALRQLSERHQAEIHKLRNVELAAANAALQEHQEELVEARDQAQAADRAKTAFLANLSHDIRTPLNGVMGLTDALLTGELPAQQRRMLETIRASGEMTLAILGDVLDLSSLEGGRVTAESTPWTPRDDLSDVIRVLEASMERQDINIQLQVDPAVPERVLGDRIRVQQVVLNLVQNALKFTVEGGVMVAVEGRDAGKTLAISVQDTGPGLPAGDPERLFEPFAQGQGEGARSRGVGLGLAICRRLATLMAGTLTARNRPDSGAEFTLCVPLVAAWTASPPEPGLATHHAGARVLVAEDEPVNQEVARQLLSALGLEVEVVDDGAQAVERVRQAQWDLVFLDCEMPVLDGYGAARAIRDLGSQLPLVALTANALEANVLACREAGMDEVLTKPVVLERVQEVVERLLARK